MERCSAEVDNVKGQKLSVKELVSWVSENLKECRNGESILIVSAA